MSEKVVLFALPQRGVALYKRTNSPEKYVRYRDLRPCFHSQSGSLTKLGDLREFVQENYDDPDAHAYADIISGTQTDRGEEYQRLREDIEDSVLDIVVVHELSQLSRLGAGEIHEFLEFCRLSIRASARCSVAVYVVGDHLCEHGPANKRGIVAEGYCRSTRSGMTSTAPLEKVKTGDRYRGAWWRRVVKPGLKAHTDVEAQRELMVLN